MFRNILVVVDGSPQSRAALKEAGELASANGGRLTLLTTYELGGHLGGPSYSVAPIGGAPQPVIQPALTVAATLQQQAEELVQGARKQVRPEVPCEAITAEGSPAEQILAQTKAGGHDLVMMGSLGRGALQALLLGSVARDVVHQSPVPVLVVPPAKEQT